MNPQLQCLIELQKNDNEINELERSKAAIPQQIESGATGLQGKKSQLKETEDVLVELQKKRIWIPLTPHGNKCFWDKKYMGYHALNGFENV